MEVIRGNEYSSTWGLGETDLSPLPAKHKMADIDMENRNLTLDQLIEKLHVLFDTDHVNVEEVQHLMESWNINHDDWKKYANYDPHRYTRNLVDTGNGKFNLILLCWGEGQGSGIHDHANSHCWLKVVEGKLAEKLYDWPEKMAEGSTIDPSAQQQMSPRQVLEFESPQITYINDSIGLHRVENTSHSEPAVSLHLYSPPFDMCRSFDERTGRPINCKVTFWSQFGERTPFGDTLKKGGNQEQT